LRGQRAIGVVYNPQYEKNENYVLTDISLSYDAFLFIDETHALHPLHMQTIKRKIFLKLFWIVNNLA
jgi:erythromycin esterase